MDMKVPLRFTNHPPLDYKVKKRKNIGFRSRNAPTELFKGFPFSMCCRYCLCNFPGVLWRTTNAKTFGIELEGDMHAR